MVAISVDDTQTNAKLADKVGAKFPLLADPDLATIKAYGLEHEGKDIALPATVIVDKDGVVQWIYVGDRPPDRPLLADVFRVLETLGSS